MLRLNVKISASLTEVGRTMDPFRFTLSKSWRSYGFPKTHKHHRRKTSAGEYNAMSDWDVEDCSKSAQVLSREEGTSRSSSQSESSRASLGSCETSPAHASASQTESYWSPPKVFSFPFTRRLRLSRRRSSSKQEAENKSESSSRPRMRPMLLDNLPSDDEDREEYMTVFVGEDKGRRETYVINRHLLTHHLFQTLMKCSKAMTEPESARNTLVPLVFCDPALFLHLVQAVGADLTADLSAT